MIFLLGNLNATLTTRIGNSCMVFFLEFYWFSEILFLFVFFSTVGASMQEAISSFALNLSLIHRDISTHEKVSNSNLQARTHLAFEENHLIWSPLIYSNSGLNQFLYSFIYIFIDSFTILLFIGLFIQLLTHLFVHSLIN